MEANLPTVFSSGKHMTPLKSLGKGAVRHDQSRGVGMRRNL